MSFSRILVRMMCPSAGPGLVTFFRFFYLDAESTTPHNKTDKTLVALLLSGTTGGKLGRSLVDGGPQKFIELKYFRILRQKTLRNTSRAPSFSFHVGHATGRVGYRTRQLVSQVQCIHNWSMRGGLF